MSDTPETDAQIFDACDGQGCEAVLAGFARKLERERNSLQDQRDFCMGEIKRLRTECDEVREMVRKLQEIKIKHEHEELVTAQENDRLKIERDEAREDAKTADEHRRLAERLAEAAMFERDQLRMRVAELENGLVVEDAR